MLDVGGSQVSEAMCQLTADKSQNATMYSYQPVSRTFIFKGKLVYSRNSRFIIIPTGTTACKNTNHHTALWPAHFLGNLERDPSSDCYIKRCKHSSHSNTQSPCEVISPKVVHRISCSGPLYAEHLYYDQQIYLLAQMCFFLSQLSGSNASHSVRLFVSLRLSISAPPGPLADPLPLSSLTPPHSPLFPLLLLHSFSVSLSHFFFLNLFPLLYSSLVSQSFPSS